VTVKNLLKTPSDAMAAKLPKKVPSIEKSHATAKPAGEKEIGKLLRKPRPLRTQRPGSEGKDGTGVKEKKLLEKTLDILARPK